MATHIKSIIEEFLKEKKAEAKSTGKIERIVEENLGENLKKHVRLQRIYKKNLIFCSDSSSASYEFRLRREGLLKAVKKEFPDIEGVKIKIGDYD
ncbi:MAG: DciA family protein [Candidatus Omnitrophica bacterium]|nr:DciA family protein [Candidatus Omnitrophota bacterium]